jgi:hypothetical protein
MLFLIAPSIKHLRIALSFGVTIPAFAALGGLVTFTTGAPLWKGSPRGRSSARSLGFRSLAWLRGSFGPCSGQKSMAQRTRHSRRLAGDARC